MRRYIGHRGLEILGLGTLLRAAFQRPVQIVRQFISHNGQTRYPAYPAYAHIITTKVCQESQHKGLSNYIVKHLCEGIKKDNNYHWYNKPYMRGMGLCGYVV
jgi:hypothetical protein